MPNTTTGQLPSKCHCQTHAGGSPPCSIGAYYNLPPHTSTFADEFHVASLNWTGTGVEIAIDGSNITVKGSKGELSRELPGGVTANLDEQTLTVVRPDDSKESRAFHGLSRSLVQNMIVGVSEGFVKELQIQGVGYRATAKGSNALELALGFSHPVKIEAPEGVEFEFLPRPRSW